MEYSILEKPFQKNKFIRIHTINDRESIIGLYLEECIRFFYEPIANKIKDRKKRRIINAYSYDFDIIEGSILAIYGTPDLKDFEFESGIYVIYTPHYFDVVSRNKLNEYMEKEHYDFRYDKSKKKVKSLLLNKVKKEIE